jgi:hypothetical protein
MSEPTVTVVKDGAGTIHYYGSGSKLLLDGLADGSLTPYEEAKPREAEVPDDSGDHDPEPVDSGPGDGERDPGPDDSGNGPGKDQPKRGR